MCHSILYTYVPLDLQGYVNFGRYDKFNYFVAGSGRFNFVQVSYSWHFNYFPITAYGLHFITRYRKGLHLPHSLKSRALAENVL